MNRVKVENGAVVLHCPACGHQHRFVVARIPWFFNGDLEYPTFTVPGRVMHQSIEGRVDVCAFRLVEGEITYLLESTHRFVGMTLMLHGLPVVERSATPEG